MPSRPLGPEHIAGLVAIYDACGRSIYGHVPIEAIRHNLKDPFREMCKEIIKDLKKHPDGLISIKKGRNQSYGITMAGINALKQEGIVLR